MGMIERFTPGGNIYPDGNSPFAMLVQAFRRQAENRDVRDQNLRAEATAADAATLAAAESKVTAAETRAKSHANTLVDGVATTVATDTAQKVAAAETRTRTYTDDKTTEVLTDARTYTDATFTATPAGQASDAAIDAGVNRAVLAQRVAPYEKLPGNGAQAVGKGELVLNVRDFGAKGDGVTDDGPAIQAAINAALAANTTTALTGAATTQPPAVFLPAGAYYIRTAVTAELNPPTGFTVNKRRLTLRGDATGSTALIFDNQTAPVALGIWRGFLTIEDIMLDGKNTYTGVMLEMGRAGGNDYVHQFTLNRVYFSRIGAGGTMLRSPWAFDGSITDCHWLTLGPGAVALDIPAQALDNCNNWSFRRCHLEQGIGATLIRVRSNLGDANYHTHFAFEQCHFETRAYNTRILDIEGCSRWVFNDPTFTHSNSPNGVNAGITAADIVNPFRIVNSNSIRVTSGNVSRQGTPTNWARKLIALGGNVRGLDFAGTYFLLNTATGMAVSGKQDLWESDAAVPYVPGGVSPLMIGGSQFNYYSNAEAFDEVTGWGDLTSSNVWTARFEPTTKALVYGYGASANNPATYRTDRVSMGKDGGFSAGYYMGTQHTITDGTTQVFDIKYDSNQSKRGIFLVYANDSSGSYALVFHGGGSLDVIAAGGNFSVGTTDSGVAGKYSLFLSNSNLAVTNRRGSNRAVVVTPFGLNI